jgi:hypothetical protein
MRPRPPRAGSPSRARLALPGVLMLVALLAPGLAHAARLVGGREQARIAHAFFSRPAHRGQAIVSTRVSSRAPAWAVVKSVRPERSGRGTASGRPPRLQSSYYHVTGARVTPGAPPDAARADLAGDLRVDVVYSGSGAETIAYRQRYRSVCAGAGGFTDEQQDTVKPMSWKVSYEVDLDALRSAVRGPAGTVLLPAVSFLPSNPDSTLSAREVLTRAAVDEGCNGHPATFDCTTSYTVGATAQGELSFLASGGLEVGVPIAAHPSGDCDPSDYTLGPSLWESGATTAVTKRLGLVGAALPANPYAPVSVSWPKDSLALVSGSPSSPCQGDPGACRDTFRWTGHVALQNAP